MPGCSKVVFRRIEDGLTFAAFARDNYLILESFSPNLYGSPGMPNSYFDPGEQRAAKVQSLFNRIASRYDLINDLQSFGLHRLWKRRVLALAAPKNGESALDLCCGTGDLAIALSGVGASVIGVDFSERMIEVAAQRARKTAASEAASHRRALTFILGDAQKLPFCDQSFDVVTMGYGLRNLPSWENGLREIHRVLKPQGRAIILEFGKPPNSVWRRIYFAYLKMFVPILGATCCGDRHAYAYILESLQHYPGQGAIADRMSQSGWANVDFINFLGGIMSINYGERPGP
jgi:demethylmenaquinone methyltransferase/2-methoxy-6-polyprenyl-1,4-benzoquinol methylase